MPSHRSSSSESSASSVVACTSSFESYSEAYACETLDMMDVRGVRGGCDERGFIWKDEVSLGGSYDEMCDSCTEMNEEDAACPCAAYGNVMEDMAVGDSKHVERAS